MTIVQICVAFTEKLNFNNDIIMDSVSPSEIGLDFLFQHF